MTIEPAPPNRLAEVRRLTEALIDHVLEAQVLGRPVPQEQSEALIKAAFFLRECNLPWWPMLAQALHGLGRGTDEGVLEAHAEDGALEDIDQQGLTRFLAELWRQKGQP
ncbi:hypothetical protein FV228_01710 [Methylobacterium sp. WL18]|uniref:hypothetical protein n=1 Tax=Methylobacterium sp. WL18 TaxID=2603897 RepID=UPI0011CA8F78|nr:hypothetical protein [Methylobacterium sp. WL18]TXN76102.1 hypothetical protein FV228_01710 [Methylobacterium sp. WL18]